MFMTTQKTYLYSDTEKDRLGRPKRISAGSHLVPQGHKRCSRCEEVKPISDFSRRSRKTGALHSHCKECNRANMRSWAYGLSDEDHAALLQQQDGVCAVCREEGRPLVVDHNHRTGAVRGLLCADCNIGIGRLRDNPDYLRAAAEYLGGAPFS